MPPVATARKEDVSAPMGAVELEVVTQTVPAVVGDSVTGEIPQDHDIEPYDAELGLSSGLLD